MKIVISGGTGFIGSYLLQALTPYNHDIVLLIRIASHEKIMNNSAVRYKQWNPLLPGDWMSELDGTDVVINMIGKNVFENRWNEKVKQEIFNSRILPTRLVVDAIRKSKNKPQLLISVSAVGYYGHRADELLTEQSPSGDDYLAYVVNEWESAAREAEKFQVRVATPRIGLVLQKNGGMIGKMLLPFQCFVGGPIGNGRQYLPWIHMTDVVRGILFPISNESFHGAYNLVSPHPIPMKEFASTFGKILNRPSWLPVPEFGLTLLYGEGAKAILSGQNVIPKKLVDAGYQFSFSDLSTALRDILL